jgi:hypothetical protein
MKHALCLSAVLCVLSACDGDLPAPRKGQDVVVSRSPDQRLEAVVREVNIEGSVMVSQPYQVLVRSLLLNPEIQSEVLLADKTDGFRLRWTPSGQLEVCYADAKIHRFTNSFVAVGRENREVVEAEIVLRRTKSLSECEA